MAKKKQKATIPASDQLEDLVQLAHGIGLPDAVFEDELWDACESDARLTHEQLCTEGLLQQLTFLYERGYKIERLKELIRELSGQ